MILDFSVNEQASSVTYSLDGNPNATASNTTLVGLANGAHSLTIYATDLSGNSDSSSVTFTVSVPNAPAPSAPAQSGGGPVPSAGIVSANVSTHSPGATSQVIVQNGKVTLRFASIAVDSVCKETITPTYFEQIDPNASATYTVNFDCTGVPYGDYPVTYSLQLLSGKVIASKTYVLKVTADKVIAPGVIILATASPDLTPGQTGTLVVTVQNSGNTSASGNVTLSVPNGLAVTPLDIPITLQPGETKDVSFEVTASDTAGAPAGLGPVTGFASFLGIDVPSTAKLNVSVNYQAGTGFDTVSKVVDLNVNPRLPFFLIVIAVAVIGFLYYFFYYKKPKQESKEKAKEEQDQ